MVKHTKTIRRQQPTNYLSVFDHFVRLVLKDLKGSYQKLNQIFVFGKDDPSARKKVFYKKLFLKISQNSQ